MGKENKNHYFGVGLDQAVWKHNLNGKGKWNRKTRGAVTQVEVTLDYIFGLGFDARIYINDGNWRKITTDEVDVTSFQVVGNDIIALGNKRAIYKATLVGNNKKKLTASAWQPLTKGSVTAFTVSGSLIYGVGMNKAIWKHNLDGHGKWKQITKKGKVSQVGVVSGTVYGLGMDKAIWRYSSVKNKWYRIASGDVVQFAVDPQYIHALQPDQAIWRAPIAGGAWTRMTKPSITFMANPLSGGQSNL